MIYLFTKLFFWFVLAFLFGVAMGCLSDVRARKAP